MTGPVYLVGAGPGDPGLLTARALELIARADVVLHDRLIPREALAGARPDAEVVDVGKVGGGEQVPQDETTRLLVEHARAGRDVVRLKGGDPFVFGRGGEEAQALRAAGLPFEVVPGVTAGVAAPALRRASRSPSAAWPARSPSSPATRTRRSPRRAIDWPALAAFPGTLVFYMGVRQLPRIAEQLVAAGRAADEPAAVVERGTLPGQRTVRAPHDRIVARRRAGCPRAGDHGRRPRRRAADELGVARGRGPLAGRTVAVTRARAQASGARGAPARARRATSSRRPRSASSRSRPSSPDLAAYDLLVPDLPNGVERALSAACATPARSPGLRSR